MKTDALPRIVLHHADGARSHRVRWVLEELGLPYALRIVEVPARLRQPDYLAINPLGKVPTLEVDGLRIFESMAACEYLARTCGPSELAVDPGEAGYADFLQFAWYGEATLMGPLGKIVRYSLLEPEERRVPQVLADADEALKVRLAPVIDVLAERAFLAAGRCTLADVSVAYALRLAIFLGRGDALAPELSAYLRRLEERPAYRRAYELQG